MPVTTRAVARISILLVSFAPRSAFAQTVAVASCMEANVARAMIEDKLRELAPRLRGYVRDAACAEGACTVEIDLMPADPACRIDPPPEGVNSPTICRFPRGDCPDQPGLSSDAFDPLDPALERCLRDAVRATSKDRRCERIEPISDPVAPPPPPMLRLAFDLGAGLRSKDPRLDHWLLSWGAALDWHFAAPFTAGARVGFVGAAARALDSTADGSGETQTPNMSAVEPGLRLRWLIGKGDVRGELEANALARLTLTDAIDGHAAAGVGAWMYLRQFGWGVRYTRAFGEPALRDSLVVYVERSTRLEYEGWPRSPRGLPRVGLGLHAIVTGWGFARGLGVMLPGAALELPVDVGWPVVPVVRADFLWFPGIDGPALTTQSTLAGLQYYRLGELPFGLSALGGYAITYGSSPRVAQGGPIADGGVWYWLDDLGFHLGVHARMGLVEVNRDLRAIYLTLGGRQIF